MTSRIHPPSRRPNVGAVRPALLEPRARRARSSEPATIATGTSSAARRGDGPRSRALAALVALAALPAAAQTPVGPPIDLSLSTPCSQNRPAVAPLASGETVTAWVGPLEAAPEDYGVGARIAGWPGGAGQPLSDELRLDDPADDHFPRGVSLAAAPDRFYAAWWGQKIQTDPGHFLLLRAFDAAGEPLGDAFEAADLGDSIITGAALAADPQGRPALAWQDDTGAVYLRLFEHDLTPRGEPIVISPPAPAEPQRGETPALAIAADGGMLLAWGAPDAGPPAPSPAVRVLARRVAANGSPQGAAFAVNDLAIAEFVVEPAATAIEGGGYAVLWSTRTAVGVAPGIYGRRLAANGAPSGAAFAVSSLDLDFAADPDVAAVEGSGFLAVWSATREGANGAEAFARYFGPGGHAAGPELPPAEVPDPALLQSRPAVAAVAAGRAFVAWRQHFEIPPITPPPCVEQATIVGQPLTLGCVPSDTRLCLRGGRFAVEVTADATRPGTPFPLPAGARPLTADTGTFWFFRPENVELMVKLLDGRGVNGFYWFFSGALSNVGYEIVVTDTLTGVERRYENLSGELASRADTTAFEDPLPPPSAPEAAGAGVLASAGASAPPPAPGPRPLAGATHPVAPCSDPAVLCLHDERIQVRIDWTDPRGGDSGSAVAMPLSDESGWFWFFRPENAEAVVKVLYGWPVNDFYWVFFGGLTDLELTISVEDVFAGTGKTYHNPPFTLTSFADTAALPGPFPCPVCSAAAPASSTRSADGDGSP